MGGMTDDAAGPLLGWSIGAGMARRPLDELVEFPCNFCFKAVGKAAADFASTMVERVQKALGRTIEASATSVRQSAGGNYECVTMNLWVTSGAEIYEVYEAMRADARVKYLL